MKKGQAMIEALIAVLFIAFVFSVFYSLSRMLTATVVLEHAAARAARARCVGFSDFMCEKAAKVAMIPVAGRRTVPENLGGDFATCLSFEEGRIPVYLCARLGVADGVLDYERWNDLSIHFKSRLGAAQTIEARLSMEMPKWNGGNAKVGGVAKIESHYPLYME